MPTHFLFIIDVTGTATFAVSGAILAMEKRLDIFGILVIAFVTAIGGGTLRDMMIGNLPVNWLLDPTTTIVIFCSAAGTILFGRHLKHFSMTLNLFDALGLGLFTVVGIKLGIEKQFSMPICIMLGTITACFGGVVRDILLNEIPLLFRKEIYATACIIGGLVYFTLQNIKVSPDTTTIICILVIFIVRMLVIRYKLSLPGIYRKNSADG